jgi:acylglycerol lipase
VSVSEDRDHFATEDGLTLLRRRWSGPQAARVVCLVHGFAEHSARYDHVARALCARGYRVHAFDQRGHGESEGPRNYTPSFGALLDDIARFVACVRALEGDRPLCLFGHSMGGLEVARVLCERRVEVAVGVLSGPALHITPPGRLLTALVRMLARVAPRTPIPQGLPASALSHDPEVVRAYEADPLISPRASARLAVELVEAAATAAEGAERIEVPLLIVHGEADALCDVEGSRRFHARLDPARAELITYPELYHEVLNEPQWQQVLDDICGWIEKRVPAV